MNRRYVVQCNHSLPRGADRWFVKDSGRSGAVGGYYFTTKADAQEWAKELNEGEAT